MRTILFVSFLATAASFSTDLIKEHVINGLDKNVSPCDDFYAHVCPIKMTTKQTIISQYDDLFLEMSNKIDMDSFFPDLHKERELDNLEDDALRDDLLRTCEESEEGRELISEIVSLVLHSSSLKNLTCHQYSLTFNSTPFNTTHIPVLTAHRYAPPSVVFTILRSSTGLHPLDSFTTSLFDEIKVTLRESLKQTPWLRTYKAVEKYLNFADHKLMYSPFTVADAKEFQEIYNRQLEIAEECSAKLRNSDIATACVLYAVVSRGDHKNTSRFFELSELAIDIRYFGGWNTKGKVVISRPTQLAGYLSRGPQATARKFGSLGHILAHEIMHSFIHSGHQHDPPELKNYWTNSSACVTRQYKSTCKAFLKEYCVTGTKKTFEEDGADVAGMRLAYAAFQKDVGSKNSDVKGITQDQMFFYAFASIYCDNKTVRLAPLPGNHSQYYIRVNAIVSQMDKWKAAFKCRDDSRMIRTKTEHCSIYGYDAPLTRKTSS